jgi:hypothetical protein
MYTFSLDSTIQIMLQAVADSSDEHISNNKHILDPYNSHGYCILEEHAVV